MTSASHDRATVLTPNDGRKPGWAGIANCSTPAWLTRESSGRRPRMRSRGLVRRSAFSMTATRRSTGGSPDAELNTCANALDRHIAERGDQAALIYDSPVTGSQRVYTYRELLDETARFAGALRNLGGR